jgi:hypothetical protein
MSFELQCSWSGISRVDNCSRRSEVIDAMVEAHAISEAEASTAKDDSLPIMTK